MNRNVDPVEAKVTVTPEDPSEQAQSTTVHFPSTGRYSCSFLTISVAVCTVAKRATTTL